ncbi:hypothetical protein ETB97_006065 [Aspergillus alliaceus]|uniref:Xylanolytic transcriptional activator regulatory domain-containing protein n=1 Tax=Petromyces alliaceus TaxID=209559 RepID=A0A8H6E3L5_PETAA|nr:hypothetical protein ETB97_006065 [Aspergillus burnettii]
MSGGAVDNRCRSTDQEPREEDFGSQWKGSVEHKTAATEKVAGGRPFLRFMLYGLRVLIMVDSVIVALSARLEHISNKIDELGEIIKRLGDERLGTPGFANPAELRVPSYSLLSAQQCSSPRTASKSGKRYRVLIVCPSYEALQATVVDSSYGSVATERTSALNHLWTTVNVQRQKNETLEGSRPFPKELPSGFSLGDLPISSLEKTMTCLRIAQEGTPSQLYWPFEFGSLTEFTQYVIKACSPRPITDMELIIVHYVLSWLFIECSNRAALGLHSNRVVAVEPAEGVQRKISLFWAIYVREKSVSLRLGRPSTIRDQDITVPRLLMGRKMTSLAYHRMLDWIDVASLHGRV